MMEEEHSEVDTQSEVSEVSQQSQQIAAAREAQREKWQAKKAKEQAQKAEEERQGASASSSSAAGSSVRPAASSAAAAPTTGASASFAQAAASASNDGPTPFIRRVHILPVGTAPDPSGPSRFEILAPELKARRAGGDVIKNGSCLRSGPHEFVVVKADPDEGLLGPETDYFVEGEAIPRFEKVQFICLWDYESSASRQDPSVLFSDYISPHFRGMADDNVANVVTVGDVVKISDHHDVALEFQVFAAEPSGDIGIVESNTMVFVDWDCTPEFEKIHIVPFQDTLPGAYEFDIFNDYLKPYLTRNKLMRFGVNDQFTYQGVQFKVVCCEPNGPARIGRNTTIFCEGVLHPSLRNLLPPELLEQLSNLPPGLQMLLLNTEALAGGYEERLMEVQEMLSRRRGLANETIERVERFSWPAGDSGGSDEQTVCMVCLSNFSNDEECRRLPCNHVFHSGCIDEWLRRCTDCPICKANVDRAVRQY
mmetsp:Transcript_53442/g.137897  ORF Transcript_53442/g.137897 Transcript_53442/m.137897 type:complete len:480 (-) Transcript_53442:44-1483(-)